MAKSSVPKGKLVRKFGENIFGNPKYDSLLNKKPYTPGQHGPTRRRRLSNYGVQLREKQKIKAMYGVLERQFRNYFHKAEKMNGETGTNLLQLLECRLDNVVYRLGLASTRSQARQLVSHAHFLLNNRKCNYPSATVKPGDVIQVRARSKKMEIITEAMKRIKGDIALPWLELDKAKMTGSFLAVPERDEMALTVNEQLVVELYSK
ncbi:MAG: 30S ribosomal protein S4 [Candidatus Marinimicrobia bacterium]|jgi:small subunit ribosomal protein S4|nr:30S ribosomal protein S4 [Candidatus Neomarinimicrobiota bacterium]MBT4452529.1 30S ribosomal protein S4 [Candidatus Neomarinimicrobiota bacterium]MBT5777549.1 30S ribosomal protein S4 [Candidatus Neomarinimicrobiota bacterium]MBT6942639.1 30S ribosomal protein S4 [Candidatus Neomarinimicrobiota bacterium]MBT7084404.1 30S ribosomal protein S4 [Candidatus Neomarinimicrobiota bacterium]|tara:strand:- start:4661 stop:5278 length:618 start_codon:yes stop_codon:yes gene_type:complete